MMTQLHFEYSYVPQVQRSPYMLCLLLIFESVVAGGVQTGGAVGAHTGGQRSRGRGYVRDPAAGFFVAGKPV